VKEYHDDLSNKYLHIDLVRPKISGFQASSYNPRYRWYDPFFLA
jgi:hypothetical protein